jgi:hypothetical protein
VLIRQVEIRNDLADLGTEPADVDAPGVLRADGCGDQQGDDNRNSNPHLTRITPTVQKQAPPRGEDRTDGR